MLAQLGVRVIGVVFEYRTGGVFGFRASDTNQRKFRPRNVHESTPMRNYFSEMIRVAAGALQPRALI
jgi:hypothetical protein